MAPPAAESLTISRKRRRIAVTSDGVADLARHREADANRARSPRAGAPERQRRGAEARTLRRCPKITAAFQPLEDDGNGVPITH